MGEKEQQPSFPLAPANGHPRSVDMEAEATTAAGEKRKWNRKKCIIFIIFFIVSNVAINTVFALTIMKFRNPKFRLREATATELQFGTAANPSLTAQLNVEFAVKNTNFGRYSYRNATVAFTYRGTQIGNAVVSRSRVGWRTTKKFNSVVDLNVMNVQIEDLNSGMIPITCESKLRGRVAVMFMMKKTKSADMNCTMMIVRNTQQVTNIVCK